MNNYEPPGNKGVTINGRQITDEEKAMLRLALGITDQGKITLRAGRTLTIPWGELASVLTAGTDADVQFDFMIPEGKPGLDGHGSVEAVEAVGLPFGQAPNVVNFGSPEIAKLRFFIPAGPKGDTGAGIPVNPLEDHVVGFKDGAIKWIPQAVGTGTGTTTVINNVFNVDALQGTYDWETGVVIVTPQVMFDTTTFAAYQSAVASAVMGSKRAAAAAAIINAFGVAQKLTMQRNGVTVLVADYTGGMSQSMNGLDLVVILMNLTSVSDLVVADTTTGNWTTVLSGGAGFTRTLTLPAMLDAAAAIGNGFNPGLISLVIPRSMDGL